MKTSTLGTCIRTLRMHSNMTQNQLAEALGVTDKAVSKWERDISCPDIVLFPKLADVLGATVNDLLRECAGEDCHPSKLLQTFEVSRDIRIPLHIILGFADLAKNSHDDPETQFRYLEYIQVAGEYLLSLLNCVMQESCCTETDECCSRLPLSAEDLDNYLHREVDARLERQEDYDFSGKRILIVDDMAVNREIAQEVLRQTGALTETAEDGLVCCEKIQEKPAGYYDLILMDIIMPNLDGLEATRRIRQLDDERKAQIPVIAMTTNVSAKDQSCAMDTGMDEFTEKPIIVSSLLAAMSRYLRG